MKVLVTGGTGMVGSGFKNLNNSSYDFVLVGSKDCDLTQEHSTHQLIKEISPDAIIHLAARVGGVKGNTDFVADFYRENIAINTNVLSSAANLGIKKVISLLSTCIYPDKVTYPLTEDQIHNGEPHPSNFGYAYAKRMLDIHSRALRQQYGCNFITAVPNNLYGPEDNFDLQNGHVIPAIIRKIWEAKNNLSDPIFWGDGRPLREFTFAPDVAKILIFLLENYDGSSPVNIGNLQEISIGKIVQKVAKQLDYVGPIYWDINKPSGQFKKPSSNEKLIKLGWKESHYVPFDEGIKRTCEWFVQNYPNVRGISEK